MCEGDHVQLCQLFSETDTGQVISNLSNSPVCEIPRESLQYFSLDDVSYLASYAHGPHMLSEMSGWPFFSEK